MVSRRTVVRGGSMLAAGAVAGCVGRENDGGGGTDTTSETSPASGSQSPTDGWTGPAFAQWLPAPDAGLPVGQYRFGLTDLREYADHRGSLPEGLRRIVESWRPVDLDWRTVPHALTFHGNNVVRADYDPEAVAADVGSADDWSTAGEYRGYALFESDERAVAVSSNAIVITHGYGEAATATEVARTVVDTAGGRARAYPGASDAVDAVLGELGGGVTSAWLPVESFESTPRTEPRFERQVGLGRWGRFGESGTDVRLVVVFESERAADVGAVRSYVDESRTEGESFARWRDVEVRTDGRLVVVEGSIPPRA